MEQIEFYIFAIFVGLPMITLWGGHLIIWLIDRKKDRF